MSPFAFIVGSTLVVLIAAAAWAMLRKGGVMRRGRGYAWLDLPGELPAILTEFQHSIDAAQAEAQKGTKMGEAVVAAVKAIDLALRDYQKRISDLEKHTAEGEKQSEELKKSLIARQGSLDENAKSLTALDVRLDGVGKQLTALTEQFAGLRQATESSIDGRLDGVGKQLTALTEQSSGLKQATESAASQLKATAEALRAISSGLAAVKTQVAGLSQRMEVQETGEARLSALAESTGESVAALKAASEKNTQDIVALEPRLLWKIEGLETLVKTSLAAISKSPADDTEGHEFIKR